MSESTRTERDQARPECKSKLRAIALSALVYPGVGQLTQHRWFAAAIFLPLFTTALVGFLLFTYEILVAFYSMGNDFMHAQPGNPPIREAGTCLVIALVIWAANILDTLVAHVVATHQSLDHG